MLRSYTAAHGLNGNRQATVELGENLITVRHGDKWLVLKRDGARVDWQWQSGNGRFEIQPDGSLQFPEGPVEMDMKAEEWARELMR